MLFFFFDVIALLILNENILLFASGLAQQSYVDTHAVANSMLAIAFVLDFLSTILPPIS